METCRSLLAFHCLLPIFHEAIFLTAKYFTVGENERRRNLAVCLAPIHGDYHYWLLLLQFVEFHRAVGADHFLFYYLNSEGTLLLENALLVEHMCGNEKQTKISKSFIWQLISYDKVKNVYKKLTDTVTTVFKSHITLWLVCYF